MQKVTCVAPVNIAVIKYWGKLDENLIIPLNDSFSATLSTDVMSARTTIVASPLLKENRFWLNNKEQSFDNVRLKNCIEEVKKHAKKDLKHLNYNISICSENNFPTAAGLASSAAGYACLVAALTSLYDIQGDVSTIARLGSGSACRSMYGGWVQWHKGSVENPGESRAVQIFPASHWPEMRVLILVVKETGKKNPSTSGMKRTADTSELLKYRISNVVPKRIEDIVESIKEKNFDKFAEETMRDSNNFHACCLDTFPPLLYLNEISHNIIEMVHCYNSFKKANKVAYTFDAGPNACIYLLEKDLDEFLSVVNYIFPKSSELSNDSHYYKGLPVNLKNIDEVIKNNLGLTPFQNGSLKCIIHTKVGEGPQILKNEVDHLLNDDGFPKNII